MKADLPVAIVALAWSALGCGGSVREAEVRQEGIPFLYPPRTMTVAPAQAEEPEPTPPAPGEVTEPCPLQWRPREMRTSVFTLPAELHGRMMAPLVRSLCACTRAGQILAVVAELVPERGEVTARTADRPDQDARASRSIDACLARELGAGRFEPFRVGSDVVARCPPPTPPAPRGPREPAHIPPPRPAGCGPEEARFTTIHTPLLVDRRDER